MKVLIDGLRRSMAREYNAAIRAFRNLEHEVRDTFEMQELRDHLTELRKLIGGLMCVYSDNPDDLFSNLADEADGLLNLEDDQ